MAYGPFLLLGDKSPPPGRAAVGLRRPARTAIALLLALLGLLALRPGPAAAIDSYYAPPARHRSSAPVISTPAP